MDDMVQSPLNAGMATVQACLRGSHSGRRPNLREVDAVKFFEATAILPVYGLSAAFITFAAL